jgi:hypothetical protein
MDTLLLGHGEARVTLQNFVPPDSDDPYAGGTFEVVLEGDGLSARRRVFIFAHSNLGLFFAELAEQWRGWEGTRLWESPEHDLVIEARFSAGGHVEMTFATQDGPLPKWRAQVTVEVEGGEEMSKAAATLAKLLGPES